MNFSDALSMLKEGQNIKRFSWKNSDVLKFRKVTDMNYDTGITAPWMWIEKGAMTDIWEPTQEDILSEDWMVVG